MGGPAVGGRLPFNQITRNTGEKPENKEFVLKNPGILI
jgi:hypothetical protein